MQGSVSPSPTSARSCRRPDPVGQGLVNQYPTPNIASASCGAANYTALVDRQVNTDTHDRAR